MIAEQLGLNSANHTIVTPKNNETFALYLMTLKGKSEALSWLKHAQTWPVKKVVYAAKT